VKKGWVNNNDIDIMDYQFTLFSYLRSLHTQFTAMLNNNYTHLSIPT